MKKRILLVISIVLVICGITGGLFIRHIFFNEDSVTTYYTRQEAADMIAKLDCEYRVDLQDQAYNKQGYTVGDAKTALEALQIDEISLSYDILKMKEDRILSMDQFSELYEYIIQAKAIQTVSIESVMIIAIPQDDLNTVLTQNGSYTVEGVNELRSKQIYDALSNEEEKIVKVYLQNGTIFAYCGESTDTITLHNVWIEGVTESAIRIFVENYHKQYTCSITDESKLENITNSVADIDINNLGISNLYIKSDVITAKVLAIDDKGIEIEGYGVLPRSSFYKIYKVYGELSVERTSRILVGYTTTNFVIADGVIEAALITEPIKAENIRVVLGNDDYSSLIHSTASLTSDTDYTLYFNNQTKNFPAGEVLELNLESGYLAGGRVRIEANGENSKIRILSIQRSYGNPSYRGVIEIAPYSNEGLTIVNELPLEEYLYAVVPSEMPISYGEEALKVQAMCARGYAYAKILDGSYAQYGAHLDDSTMTQVYNSSPEAEESIFAVKDTYGMVPFYDNQVISAFFFSTSCGTTCSNVDVWGGEALPYLQDRMETVENTMANLSTEADFRNFIDTGAGYNTFEQDYPFYRWSIQWTPEQISTAINANLEARIDANADNITVKQVDGSYISQNITSIGDVQSIEVSERGNSGIVKELTIAGSENTIKVRGQTNARALITPQEVGIKKQDGSESLNWALLPSPFYYIITNETGDYIMYGGGFGHGVGMSQNGTKAMTDAGYQAEDIIKHYYTGVEIRNIYQ